MAERMIGRALSRREDKRLLRGEGRFVDDFAPPGAAHMAILRSPFAHARIRSVELAAARAAPGVIDAFCGTDLDRPLPEIPFRLAGLSGFDRFLQQPIATAKARFAGEPVAAVVASDRYAAEDALAAIEVDYDPLPPVADPETAAKSDTLVHDGAGDNVAIRYTARRGDADAAFAAAPYRRRERFRTHRQTGLPLETRGLVADFSDGETLRLWGAAKVTYFNKRALVRAFGLPEDAVELVQLDVGGGFGVRGELYPEDYLVPIASRRAGRPVKWIEDRQEHLMAANHSRDIVCELEVAAERDGTILALRGRTVADLGAYARTNGGIVPVRTVQFLPGPYRIPNYSCDAEIVVTNRTPTGTYRGPGRFEANFFRERLIDLMAADLGLDPAEVRLANLLGPDELPYDIGELIPGDTGTAYSNGDYPAVLRRLLDEAGYDDWRARQGEVGADGRRHGLGIACFVESSAAGPPEHARIGAGADGRVEVRVGSSSFGQGVETGMIQIAADALGVASDAIDVRHGTTSLLPDGSGSYHSRTTVMAGNAVAEAAAAFRERCIALAALRWNAEPESLAWSEGRVERAEGETIGIAPLAAFARSRGESLEAAASFDNRGRIAWSSGAHAAHVAVDTETGEVAVLGYRVVEELGRVLNPMMAEGQAVGAAVQGIGGALLDRIRHDADGQLLTANLADYLVPASVEIPRIETVALETHPADSNPLGFKGAGEGGIIAVGAAIANAIAHALGRSGEGPTELPVSPGDVLRLVDERRK
ncbi:MAG: xanthine dehydrogenase family protein molybdopterin-binding subunit [Defluviicoccus sp.]|nr:xanthine dehydrogenase family protein molybdopterin-binding subunit [Defluviicoccus sp.]MDE0277525.1 xanthine dehydrogenase family protein molybdopterin-binding subunit [Defluviicoccus sp.]